MKFAINLQGYVQKVYFKRILNYEVFDRVQSDADFIIVAIERTGKSEPSKSIICPFHTNYSALFGSRIPQNPIEM